MIMFLGVGVDIRVHHSINFGLAATIEDLLQEGGRVMRGSTQETKGRRGYAFFFHKGALGKFFIRTCSFAFLTPIRPTEIIGEAFKERERGLKTAWRLTKEIILEKVSFAASYAPLDAYAKMICQERKEIPPHIIKKEEAKELKAIRKKHTHK